ncbi:bifunctional adenosylcobinamide kinase/adenosylcobinamide-phosphate guanylyltransferase [Paenibacillus mendelii]|uniref:Adenosylcobinamide kinase n=1 Tax=Paenibacillus mendelii TaxID=206163 RepID=A0ABV6JGA4_9BACL|nr:bifunctional adenosylcobinamide kinase/adenosylcobinamide-phosphate guanylyltransferase [Paenibacillus mendelii]MCQ6557811.1 bifunctional adenosylcobinamide kinase/adenosylcobinamide-phosphate guanylyltransferase [Paenibacillus mendelii]
MAVFITGGARSGKSDFAERYAMQLSECGIYIATSQIRDEEMAQRVEQHRQTRQAAGFPWRTIEEPYDLARSLGELDAAGYEELKRPAVVVDCLTLWLTNWMLRVEPWEEDGVLQVPQDDRSVEDVIDEFITAVISYRGPLLLVTNEVGSGIVPAYALGRRFRDAAGRMNRKLAAVCGEAYLVVAGFPLDLKAHSFRLNNE